MSRQTPFVPLHFDANATTPVLPQVQRVINRVATQQYGNPSSGHVLGQEAHHLMTHARQSLRDYLDAPSGRLLFNSGATEGINTAIFSALKPHAGQICKHKVLLYLATEHKAVPTALAYWNTVLGVHAEVYPIAVDATGQADLTELARLLPQALLICTMAVNNETGVIQDLDVLQRIIRQAEQRIPWLVDGVQAFGKVPLALAQQDIDYLPISAHKLYGPKGAGVLYVSEQAPFSPLLVGGGQEEHARGGTENIAAIAAWPKLIELLNTPGSPFLSLAEVTDWREKILQALQGCFPDLVVNQPESGIVPSVLNVAVPGYTGTELAGILQTQGLAVSTGSACSSGTSRSFVVAAQGAPAWQAQGAVRISIGLAQSADYLQQAIERLNGLAARLPALRHRPEPGLYSKAQETGEWLCWYDNGQLWIPGTQQPVTDIRHWFKAHYHDAGMEPKVISRQDLRAGVTLGDYRVQEWEGTLRVVFQPTGRQIAFRASFETWLRERPAQVNSADLHLRATDNVTHGTEALAGPLYDVRQGWEHIFSPLPAPVEQSHLPAERWYHFVLSMPDETTQPVFRCNTGRRSAELCKLFHEFGLGAEVWEQPARQG